MTKAQFSLLLTSALLFAALPVAAHHGTAVSYDASHPVTMKAVVTEFHYANPHPQLFFDVTDEKGNVVHWGGEFYPNPSQLIQEGWGKKRSEAALPPGAHITITVAPSRAGTPVGAILKLLNDQGEVIMGVAGGGPGGPPPEPAPHPNEQKQP
ncbi:MAG: DUF6152 family protein [Bryobacteraceae bacterium]|jgi:hypothetical protein